MDETVTMAGFDELLTTEEAARLMGIKKSTLDRWRQTGMSGLRYRKIGRLVRYTKRDLIDFLNENAYTHTGEV